LFGTAVLLIGGIVLLELMLLVLFGTAVLLIGGVVTLEGIG
jgi:hypothetical protein